MRKMTIALPRTLVTLVQSTWNTSEIPTISIAVCLWETTGCCPWNSVAGVVNVLDLLCCLARLWESDHQTVHDCASHCFSNFSPSLSLSFLVPTVMLDTVDTCRYQYCSPLPLGPLPCSGEPRSFSPSDCACERSEDHGRSVAPKRPETSQTLQ